jgi:hypothetical protein
VIDREFKGLDYKNFVRHVKLFLKDITQEHLTHGELSTEFYTVTDIAIKTGEIRPRHSYELRYFSEKCLCVIFMSLLLGMSLMDTAQPHDKLLWTVVFHSVSDITAMLSILSCDDTWRIYRRFRDEHLLHLAITGTKLTERKRANSAKTTLCGAQLRLRYLFHYYFKILT